MLPGIVRHTFILRRPTLEEASLSDSGEIDMITKRERAVLFLLSRKKSLTRMQLVKLMFLASTEHQLYDFVPYRYGPFSFQLSHDLRHLEREGYLTQAGDRVLFTERAFPEPDPSIQKGIASVLSRFGEFQEKDLLDYVYRQYPETTIFSRIRRMETYYRDEIGMATIGYEGKNIDRFLSILVENKISRLIDVRKNPISMKYGYSKSQLVHALEKLGISYLHLPGLGIDGSRRKNLTDEGYAELFRRYARELGNKEDLLDIIASHAETEKVALMCFEAHPEDCHRGLIAQRFRDEGLDVIDL